MTSKSFVDDYKGASSEDCLVWAERWVSELRALRIPADLLDPPVSRSQEFSAYITKIGADASDHLLYLDVLSIVLNETISILLAAQGEYSEEANFGANFREKALISLLMSLSSCFEGARMLISAGNDHCSRILSRTISEACDLVLIVGFDEEIAKEYVKSSSDFQMFWSQYVGRGKLTKLKKATLISIGHVPEEAVDDAILYSSEEFKAFSGAVHPSYIGGVMQLLMLFDSAEDEFSFLNDWHCRRVTRYLLDSIGTTFAILLTMLLRPSGILERARDSGLGTYSDQLLQTLAAGAFAATRFAASSAPKMQAGAV
jgi:hypothetical protein